MKTAREKQASRSQEQRRRTAHFSSGRPAGGCAHSSKGKRGHPNPTSSKTIMNEGEPKAFPG